MNQKKTEFHFSDLSLECLTRFLVKNAWMIAAGAVILAMCASLYVNLVYTPLYRATTTYAVTARRTSYSTSGNINSAREATAVLTEMLGTEVTTSHICAHSPELANFSGTLQASQVPETNFIVVTVTDTSPKRAYLALDALSELMPTFTGYISANSVVTVLRAPAVSSAPINQVSSQDMATKLALLGAIGVAALLCWLFVARGTIQTRAGARHLLDAHVITTVYREDHRRWYKRLLPRKGNAPLQVFAPTTSFSYTEQINTICAQLEHEALNDSKVFMIAGVGENEGKSTIAGNVAAALAMMGKRVAVLDCDLRNPSLNQFFDGKYASGMPLNKLLSQPLTKDNLIQCMQRHEKLGLFMLFPKGSDRRCAELLSGGTMDELLRQLRVFDFVILDTPPMGFFAEAEALAQKADASILVVRQDTTPACDINDAVDTLRSSGAKFLGCVLNDMTASLTEGYGYGYGKYGYGYGQSHKKTTGKGG